MPLAALFASLEGNPFLVGVVVIVGGEGGSGDSGGSELCGPIRSI